MTRPVTAILIGAGNRGRDVYGRYALAHPDQLRFLAVAEPDPGRRARTATEHDIPVDRRYESWEGLLDQPQPAEAAFVCTQDRLHTGPALAALAQGYHVLLEKPMATTAADCRALVAAAEGANRHLQIGHVLRYAPFFQAIHGAVSSGRLGRLISLSQRENVSYYHMAHSFVRGNWCNDQRSSPMILAKCCHDLDILYWLAGAPAARISSAGNLMHFRPENAPPGAPPRCTDGCPAEAECIYSAIDIYVRLRPLIRVAQRSGNRRLGLVAGLMDRWPDGMDRLARFVPPLRQFAEYSEWPVSTMTTDFSRAGRMAAIQDPANPYGRCVYHGDNDVVDHQHVAIEFKNGITATLIMHGHSYAEGRTVRLDGTRATLVGEMYQHGQELLLHDKGSGRSETLFQARLGGRGSQGHGGGDARLTAAFVDLLRRQPAGPRSDDSVLHETIPGSTLTDARGALESHLMAFAAEQARLEQRVVQMEEMR
jgi:predicted dehydrogenase